MSQLHCKFDFELSFGHCTFRKPTVGICLCGLIWVMFKKLNSRFLGKQQHQIQDGGQQEADEGA